MRPHQNTSLFYRMTGCYNWRDLKSMLAKLIALALFAFIMVAFFTFIATFILLPCLVIFVIVAIFQPNVLHRHHRNGR